MFVVRACLQYGDCLQRNSYFFGAKVRSNK